MSTELVKKQLNVNQYGRINMYSHNIMHRVAKVVHMVENKDSERAVCGAPTSTPNLLPVDKHIQVTCTQCLAIAASTIKQELGEEALVKIINT